MAENKNDVIIVISDVRRPTVFQYSSEMQRFAF